MLCILVRTKQNLLFPLTKVFSPSLTEYAVGSQQSMLQLFHLVSLVEVNSPFVKRGSGSFLKKDFSKLLITFKSRHFWVCEIKIQYFCSQYHQRKKNNKNQQHRPVIQTEIPKLKKKKTQTYIILYINISHSLVELLLHTGDGCIVSRDSVNTCIFETSFFN